MIFHSYGTVYQRVNPMPSTISSLGIATGQSPMGTEGDGRQYTGQWVKNRMHGAPGNAFDVDKWICVI